jgi:hypothetical protein
MHAGMHAGMGHHTPWHTPVRHAVSLKPPCCLSITATRLAPGHDRFPAGRPLALLAVASTCGVELIVRNS